MPGLLGFKGCNEDIFVNAILNFTFLEINLIKQTMVVNSGINEYELNLEFLSEGMYFVKVMTSNNEYIQRLIIH